MRGIKKSISLLCVFVFCLCLFSACANNNATPNNISAISSDDPEVGFWVSLQAEENTIEKDAAFTAKISFGTYARNLERITVAITSDDFEVSKSCPDEYIIDSQKYSNEDFYVNASGKITSADLPQYFTLSLTPKTEKDIYSGSVDIVVTEYMVGGQSEKKISLYYYGGTGLTCFSANSQQEAEDIYNTKKS